MLLCALPSAPVLQKLLVHIPRAVACTFLCSFSSLTRRWLFISRYTASAQLVPARYRARVRVKNCSEGLVLITISGWMACRMAQHSWCVFNSMLVIFVAELRCYTGQIAGISSTEFGLANMILAAVSVGKVCRWSKIIIITMISCKSFYLCSGWQLWNHSGKCRTGWYSWEIVIHDQTSRAKSSASLLDSLSCMVSLTRWRHAI